jgi:RNA polymerase sigma factor (TIGR02999 family)
MNLEPDVALLLEAMARGDQSAAETLFPIVYDELHRIASAYMRQERPEHTLQATALVHEAFLRLAKPHSNSTPIPTQDQYESRRHFVATAAVAMRRILINHAKARATEKRSGGALAMPGVEEVAAEFSKRSIDLLALEEALQRLAVLDARQARLVELRFFGGMTFEDCASTLGISVRTVHSEWAHARAWLRGQIERE